MPVPKPVKAAVFAAIALALPVPAEAVAFSCRFVRQVDRDMTAQRAIDERVTFSERTAVLAEIRSESRIEQGEMFLGSRFASFIVIYLHGGVITYTIPLDGGPAIRSAQFIGPDGRFQASQSYGECRRTD